MSHPHGGTSVLKNSETLLDFNAFKTNFRIKVASEQWLNIGGRDYRLVGKNIRIGRAPDNDIVLDHKSCSRYHAVLSVHEGRVTLEDLKSRNGIVVNGAAQKRAELSDNDNIRIGDLAGVFFERKKAGASKLDIIPQVFEMFTANAAVVSGVFSKLESKKKKQVIALAVMGVLGLLFLSSRSKIERAIVDTSAASNTAIVFTELDRKAFDRCLETEDLGNFRQASSCFKMLPPAAEVQIAKSRIAKRQEELTELRYREGSQAFDNYYYDIAILKWQEVLLVADDGSEYREKASSGIRKAEERKRLR